MEFGRPLTLDGLAKEWEAMESVRKIMRGNRRLFVSCAGGTNFDPACHVKEAAVNEEVLTPLLKYRDLDGTTQLFRIKQVEEQRPGECWSYGIFQYKPPNTKLVLKCWFRFIIGVNVVCCSKYNHIRIQRLHLLLRPGHTPEKLDVKKDAWLAKGFVVLVKRKRSRGHKARIPAFQRLLDILENQDSLNKNIRQNPKAPDLNTCCATGWG